MRILSQSNGGKSSALNHAIGHVRHEILVAVDADTISVLTQSGIWSATSQTAGWPQCRAMQR